MNTGVTRLADLAAQILGALVGYYDEMGVPLPAARYRYAGVRPPADVDQLVISARIEPGTPGRPRAVWEGRHGIYYDTATFTIWLWRPMGSVLTAEGFQMTDAVANPAEAADADGVMVMTDEYMVRKALKLAHSAGQLGTDSCSPLGLRASVPFDPAGGLGGCQTEFDFELI